MGLRLKRLFRSKSDYVIAAIAVFDIVALLSLIPIYGWLFFTALR